MPLSVAAAGRSPCGWAGQQMAQAPAWAGSPRRRWTTGPAGIAAERAGRRTAGPSAPGLSPPGMGALSTATARRRCARAVRAGWAARRARDRAARPRRPRRPEAQTAAGAVWLARDPPRGRDPARHRHRRDPPPRSGPRGQPTTRQEGVRAFYAFGYVLVESHIGRNPIRRCVVANAELEL